MQTLSGLSGRLSQGESDHPPSGRVERSEGRVGLILPLALLQAEGVTSPLSHRRLRLAVK